MDAAAPAAAAAAAAGAVQEQPARFASGSVGREGPKVEVAVAVVGVVR